jgi:hypothetical protein
MSRLLQSTLHPGTASEWLADLQADARVAALSPAHPTFLVRLVRHEGGWLSRHELIYGLFRTSWTCLAELDEAAGRLVAREPSAHFDAFEQTLCWSTTEHGLSIQSDCSWSGCKPGLEDLVLRSLLRFPGWRAAGLAEPTTRRMAVEGRSVA